VHRDAWSPQRLRDLLRRRGLLTGRRLRFDEAPRVVCQKTFLLGAGVVEDARPVFTRPGGGAFGFLTHGPFDAAQAELRLHLGPGERLQPPAFPFQRAGAGGGRFTAERGWRADEAYSYRFATTSGTLVSAGYQPAALTRPSGPRPCGASPPAGSA
jgi:hypothetical protein